MSNVPEDSDRPQSSETSERDELRTISFRMREIQRLLSVRVEQENRKLEAEGIEPVSVSRFRDELAAGEATDE